ncbi:MAG: right-handed parallel beta-helix repeat-containing protein [Actinomycetota bacterium]|nr:right-handed parallel beta-helix repeat-containing protein [Actinomycetota bacterium]
MRMRHLAGGIVILSMLAASCTGTGEDAVTTTTENPLVTRERCTQMASELIDEMQAFVDRFARTTFADLLFDEVPGLAGIEERLAEVRQQAADEGCDAALFEIDLEAHGQRLGGKGPVGRALAAALKGNPPIHDVPPTDVTVGPGDDLAEAISTAGPGSTITVEGGTYVVDELLWIDRSLTIAGSGLEDTIIQSPVKDTAIVVPTGGDLKINGLSIEHIGSEPASVLVAAGGGLSMRDVLVTGGIPDEETGSDGHGLAIVSPGGPTTAAPSVEIADSVFTGNARIGIAVFGSAEPEISDSSVYENGACGVCYFGDSGGTIQSSTIETNDVGIGIGDRAGPIVDGNTIETSGTVGILIENTAAPVVSSNEIIDNAGSGIEVVGSAVPSIRDNEIRGSENGLLVLGTARPTVRTNRFEANEVGVSAAGDARMVLESNAIVDSALAGFVFTDQAGGIIRANDFGAQPIGAQIGGTTNTFILENTFEADEGLGLLYVEEATGLSGNNTFSGLDVGIQLDEDTVVEVDGGTMTGTVETAILVTGSAQVTISRLTIEHPEVGVFVDQDASVTLDDLSISDAEIAGIIFGGSAVGGVSGCDVSGSGSIGIQIGDSAAPSVDQNTISESGDVGLIYLGSARGTASSNTISGGRLGIQVADSAAPTISRNTVRGMSSAAIVFVDDAGGGASGNSCSANAGIVLVSGASPTLGQNDCSVSRQG